MMNEPEPRGPRVALRDLAAYLRHPRLTTPLGIRKAEAWRVFALLLALELAVLLAVILPLVELWQHAFGLPDPTAFDQLPPGWLLPIALVAAPIGEEIAFRGWLTGRVRALWLLGCAVAIALLAYVSTKGAAPLAVGIGTLVLILAAPIGWFVLRKRGTPRWFERAFPAIFYLVLIAFALTHLTNYPRISLLLVPMVLPQAWIGLMLGYTRMRVGLIGSMLMHLTSNGVVLLASMVAG